ncbi:right-handed parallel beta-helix repeat-containing protein [Chloroflexi bacterium TSY]|nr:right-handed parallel beta-helix repeat-containing protein [Chloroflexi bacterium TSY]
MHKHPVQPRSILIFIALIIVTAALLWGPPQTAKARPLLDCPAANILYVDANAQGANDGTSWTDAYIKLQDALAEQPNCSDVDQIWVAAGVYYPDEGGGQTDNDRNATFQLLNGVTLYGGFDGSENSVDQRDIELNVTILSGDIDGDDTNSDNNFVAESADDIVGNNAYHVVIGSGTDDTTALDGFTVTAGKADGSGDTAKGGGMFNDNGSPTVRNVTFSGNSAKFGGGVYNHTDSSPTLSNVRFVSNSADNRGGGMYIHNNSNPTLNNVEFISNSTNDGGGIYSNNNSNPELNNVTFSGNSANYGGAMYNNNSSNPELNNVTFSNNSATSNGGGMLNFNLSNPELNNVHFDSNSALINGGGMLNNNSAPILNNVTFSNNSADKGGGMYNRSGSSPNLTIATFTSNSAVTSDDHIHNIENSNPVLTDVTLDITVETTSQVLNNGDGLCSLTEAIINANDDAKTHADCTTGIGSNTIVLTNTVYTIDSAYNNTPNGLPAITSTIIISGNGATIERNSTAPDFRLLLVDAGGDLALNDVTLSGGKTTTGGGAIRVNSGGTLTLNSSTIHDSEAQNLGGSIAVIGGTVTVNNSTIHNNSAQWGGGIGVAGGTLMLTDSTIRNNNATDNGGGLSVEDGGTMTVTHSTIRGNEASNNGGGIVVPFGGTLYVSSSTIRGNNAQWGGGILIFESATLNNSTLSDNEASNQGGGIYMDSTGTLTLTQSLVAGNRALGAGEVRQEVGGTVNSDGTNLFGHSGLTNAQAFIDFSPGTSDIVATGDGADATALTDILIPTLGVYDGSMLVHALLSDSPAVRETSFIGATAQVVPATINVEAAQAEINAADGHCSLAEAIVNANNDAQIHLDCRPGVGSDTILLSSQTYTISIPFGAWDGLPWIVSPITIEGVGDEAAIVRDPDASDFRLLWVNPSGDLTLNAVTLSGGNSTGGGGAIGVSSGASLTVINSTISGNKAAFNAGGIGVPGGTLTVINSTIRDNETERRGGGISTTGGTIILSDTTISGNKAAGLGGGLNVEGGGTLTVTNSTISDNDAIWWGGAIHAQNGVLTVDGSTISSNEANFGGGIHGNVGSSGTVQNSALSGNAANTGGGGIWVFSGGTLTINSSTLSDNMARFGGGVASRGTLTLVNSLVAGNRAPSAAEILQQSGTVTANATNLFGHSGFDCGTILDPFREARIYPTAIY